MGSCFWTSIWWDLKSETTNCCVSSFIAPTTVAGVLFVRIFCFVVYVFSFMFVFVFDSGFGFVAIVLFLSFFGEIC